MTEQNKRPVLIFPSAAFAEKSPKGGGGGSLSFPPKDIQTAKFDNKFKQLATAFEQQNFTTAESADGVEPERVLVIEVNGEDIQNFANAIEKIPGMELLAESLIEDIEPTEYFAKEDKKKGKKKDSKIKRKIFMAMSNQQAAQQLQSLWEDWKAGKALKRGITPFQNAFKYLHDIRFWGVMDRLEDTGIIEDWKDELQKGEQTSRFEVEFWFREQHSQRTQSETELSNILQKQGGKVLKLCTIPEICYHAALVEAPISLIKTLVGEYENKKQIDVFFVDCHRIQYFRPTGQSVGQITIEESVEDTQASSPSGLTQPVVALLDGVPIANHPRLANRLTFDDPLNYQATYPAQHRKHGTAMASVIVHGDMHQEIGAISSVLYSRPLMSYDATQDRELVPKSELFVDLLHRAVRRIFEGEGTEPPAAPSIRIINLSIGDVHQPFIRDMSKLAQLIDWLSQRYKVLFIISTGNYGGKLVLDMDAKTLRQASDEQVSQAIILALAKDARNRKILAPAESVNALTVGAVQYDSCPPEQIKHTPHPSGERFQTPELPYTHGCLPTPYSALGLGYRGAVKPDIVLDGGRIRCREIGGIDPVEISLPGVQENPGIKVAAPGKAPTQLNHAISMQGSSNAAALATHWGEKIYQNLKLIDQEAQSGLLDNGKFDALFIKALLVHGASCREGEAAIAEAVKPLLDKEPNPQAKSLAQNRYIARMVGFGRPDTERVMYSLDNRVLMLGRGEIGRDQGHVYKVPLPQGLSGQNVVRRLVVTLAWFSPVNPQNLKYRLANLYLNLPKASHAKAKTQMLGWDGLGVDGTETSENLMKNCIRHIILDGNKANTFAEDSMAEIKINCGEEGGIMDKEMRVPYALAVTLEVEAQIPIFEEIRMRMQVPVAASL